MNEVRLTLNPSSSVAHLWCVWVELAELLNYDQMSCEQASAIEEAFT